MMLIPHNSQRVGIHPSPDGSKGIMVKRVHPVVLSKSVDMRIRVQAFPNGSSSLLHRIQPRRISRLLQQVVGYLIISIIRKRLANPCRTDKSRHQRVSRISLSIVRHILPLHRMRQISRKLLFPFRIHNAERQRKHVRGLYIHQFSLFRTVCSRRNRFRRLRVDICTVKKRLTFVIQLLKLFCILLFT